MIPGSLKDALTKLYPDDMVIPDPPTPPGDESEWRELALWLAEAADTLKLANEYGSKARHYMDPAKIEAAKQFASYGYAVRLTS